MSSMTDIVFLLLIFFLVTSTLVNPNALKLLLPKSDGQVSAKATLSVSIEDYSKGKGNGPYIYYVNKEQVRFGAVAGKIEAELKGEEDPTFSIFADESVPVGEVVKLMNIAKDLKCKVIMATSPEN